jgi:hypothetical protein
MSEETDHLDLSVTVGGASFTGAGAADRVMVALERFSELVANHGAGPTPAATVSEAADELGTAAQAKAEPDAQPTAPQESPASKVPLPKFLQRETIKNNSHIATAIVVWAADHDGKATASLEEIEGYWKGTPYPVPKNLRRDVTAAVKKSWLIREDDKSHTATGYGREAIGLSAS